MPAAPDGPSPSGGALDVLPWRRTLRPPGPRPSAGSGRGVVQLAHTSRTGGTSTGPWAGLDLALHVGDDPGAVRANRDLLGADLARRGATSVSWLEQVHGADVVTVTRSPEPDEEGTGGPPAGAAPRADAAVTAVPGVALAVLVADCVPVLLADPVAGVVGVAHAGRRGMSARVAVRAVEAMAALGARDVCAVLGPSICGRCYEVPADLRDDVCAGDPVARSTTWSGAPALDVAAAVLEQLRPLCRDVEQLPGCTAERPDLWSYRRQGTSGRFAGLAWVAP